MQNITIGRFDEDPEAQGVIKPADGSWQLVLDKDGYPRLYVRCKLEDAGEGKPGTGLLCVDDVLPDGFSIPELMRGEFGGTLKPEEEQAAYEEAMARMAKLKTPCPR